MEGEESVEETAVILKGLTRQFTAEDVQSLLNQMDLQYNFLYLPCDCRQNYNIGLCFVNFTDAASATRCIQEFTTMLSSPGNKKARLVVKSVSKYHVHGVGLNLAYFIASAGMRAINHEHAPRVFDELGQAISLHEAVAKYVTMDLLLKAQELKDRTVHAARFRHDASSHRSAGENMRLAQSTQFSTVAGRSFSVAEGQTAGGRFSLPRYAESEVKGRDASAAFCHQPTAWQAMQEFAQQDQPAAHQQYPAGTTSSTTNFNSLGIHASQNHGLVTPSSSSHEQSYAPSGPDCLVQQYQGPKAKCSLLRVGGEDFPVFEL